MSTILRQDLTHEPALTRSEILERDSEARRSDGRYVGLPITREAKPKWLHRAACKGMDPNLFFTVGVVNPRIVKVCAGCPVREACLAQALIDDKLNKETFGYRGGMKPIDRDRMRRGCTDVERVREQAKEIRNRFYAECGGPESDTELVHRLAGEYGLHPRDMQRLTKNVKRRKS